MSDAIMSLSFQQIPFLLQISASISMLLLPSLDFVVPVVFFQAHRHVLSLFYLTISTPDPCSYDDTGSRIFLPRASISHSPSKYAYQIRFSPRSSKPYRISSFTASGMIPCPQYGVPSQQPISPSSSGTSILHAAPTVRLHSLPAFRYFLKPPHTFQPPIKLPG